MHAYDCLFLPGPGRMVSVLHGAVFFQNWFGFAGKGGIMKKTGIQYILTRKKRKFSAPATVKAFANLPFPAAEGAGACFVVLEKRQAFLPDTHAQTFCRY